MNPHTRRPYSGHGAHTVGGGDPGECDPADQDTQPQCRHGGRVEHLRVRQVWLDQFVLGGQGGR